MGPEEKPKKVGVVKDRIKLLLVRSAGAVANLILCKGRKEGFEPERSLAGPLISSLFK